MLSFDIRSVEAEAAHVNDSLANDDPVWQQDDPRPAGALHVTGRLSSAGSGRFFWSGHIEGSIRLECRRCLEPVTATVEDETRLILAEAGDEEADDPDMFPLDPGARTIDLRPIIREQWLLNAPGFALCREECRGLCPGCGADLNAAPCACPPVADSRWAGLRSHASRPA
ncbi:MAG: YceD family protein [Gemmatimonadaceae bacterium]